MPQVNGFQDPGLRFVAPAGGLRGFQRQGMDQRKKASGGSANPAVSLWDAATITGTITLANGNRQCLSGGVFENVKSTVQKTTGKLYAEFKNISGGVGGGGIPGVGVISTALSGSTYLSNNGGVDALPYGEIRNHANAAQGALPAWSTAGDIVSMAVDIDNRLVWFCVNGGTWIGTATGDPATGANGVAVAGLAASGPLVLGGMPSGTCTFELNTGQAAFAYAMPAGFSNWG